MRYLIKFSKESDIKFISHLDLMRSIQKIIKRAGLPIEYSKGFNPHMSISLAQPLSVGMYSLGEYADIVFTEDLDEEYIKDKLNNNAPEAINFIEVIKVPKKPEGEKKVPKSMAAIDAAKYTINIKYNSTKNLKEELIKMNQRKEWNIIKKSKKGVEKQVNIKPLLKKFNYSIDNNNLKLQVLLSCGSRENLSADTLAKYIQENTTEVNKCAFINIKREEMYGIVNKELVPLYKYVTMI